MLSVITHQIDRAYPAVLDHKLLDDLPTFISATIVDQNEFELSSLQSRLQFRNQRTQAMLGVKDGNNNRDGHWITLVGSFETLSTSRDV